MRVSYRYSQCQLETASVSYRRHLQTQCVSAIDTVCVSYRHSECQLHAQWVSVTETESVSYRYSECQLQTQWVSAADTVHISYRHSECQLQTPLGLHSFSEVTSVRCGNSTEHTRTRPRKHTQCVKMQNACLIVCLFNTHLSVSNAMYNRRRNLRTNTNNARDICCNPSTGLQD